MWKHSPNVTTWRIGCFELILKKKIKCPWPLYFFGSNISFFPWFFSLCMVFWDVWVFWRWKVMDLTIVGTLLAKVILPIPLPPLSPPPHYTVFSRNRRIALKFFTMFHCDPNCCVYYKLENCWRHTVFYFVRLKRWTGPCFKKKTCMYKHARFLSHGIGVQKKTDKQTNKQTKLNSKWQQPHRLKKRHIKVFLNGFIMRVGIRYATFDRFRGNAGFHL